MSYFMNAMRCVAIILGMASALAFSGCATSENKSTRIGEMSKFDIATASPDEIAEALEKDGKVVISGGVLFETDSAKLAPSTGDLVRRIANVMKKNPNLKISVVGHTDSTGDYNYNVKLSERRAKAFVAALIQDGVAANRLTGVGVGPQSPVATNDTAEGRAQNRRVELVVIR
ncbi:OmpA family protein [Fundidesulfovibrio terrae]|uniref:OmpA family protein n=1 Tax=Fundidesulfovibrio terrae TaxID=2922866 RepID=UPI001FAF3811|nr:OmpA family protein [Fundidesulfovibrio terrae]